MASTWWDDFMELSWRAQHGTPSPEFKQRRDAELAAAIGKAGGDQDAAESAVAEVRDFEDTYFPDNSPIPDFDAPDWSGPNWSKIGIILFLIAAALLFFGSLLAEKR